MGPLAKQVRFWLHVVMRIALLLLLSFASTQALAVELRPFTTDGCTLAPDGTPRRPQLFRQCCVAHDLRFWGGGTKAERDRADLELRACISDIAGPLVGEAYYAGVRAGQYVLPYHNPLKRWGNAWYERDGYRQLSAIEIDELINATSRLEIAPEIRDDYISELKGRPI